MDYLTFATRVCNPPAAPLEIATPPIYNMGEAFMKKLFDAIQLQIKGILPPYG